MQVIGGFCGEDVCECASYDRNKGNSVHKAPLGTNIVRLKRTRCKHLDAGIVALLAAERRKHQQIMAGIPDGADIDLTLIKLPEAALIFPADLDARTPTLLRTCAMMTKKKNEAMTDAVNALGTISFQELTSKVPKTCPNPRLFASRS